MEGVAMRYSKLIWRHDSPTEPTRIISEYDANGWERRKVEIFADGSVAFASSNETVGGARLSEIRCPADDEVLSPEMNVVAITADEFEREWDSARRAAAIHS